MISATGAEKIKSLMNAQLSKDVFSESAIVVDNNKNNIDTTTTASESSKRKSDTYNSKGRPPPSSSTTNETILKFVDSTLMESSNAKEKMATAWTATTASAKKDKYIREKKRIAVGLDDQAMAREVSDAYYLSLQESKAALKELQDMEAHGIPTDHPIFTATKATADLRESAFNAYLARATS
jgi:hypothetical protein